MKFENQIIQLRKENHLTQEELAEKLSVSRQAVAKWESGKSLPDINTLIHLADFFDVTLDFLVGRVENETEALIEEIKVLISKRTDEEKEDESIKGIVRKFIEVMEEQDFPSEKILEGGGLYFKRLIELKF